VQLLLLAFAVLNAAGAMVVVAFSAPKPPVLAIAGLASPPALAAAWTWAYRRRSFGLAVEAVTIAGVCAIAMAVASRWNGEVIALLSAAVFFSAAYGSMPRVIVRTGLLAAVELGEALTDPPILMTSIVFAAGLIVIALLMNGMAASIARFEATTRRSQILASAGLDLVSASDTVAIAVSTVEGAQALCSIMPCVRISMAMTEDPDRSSASPGAEPEPPDHFNIVDAEGDNLEDWQGRRLEAVQLAPAGQPLTEQHVLRRAPDAQEEEPAPLPLPPFERGEALITGISVESQPRGVLIVESTEPLPSDLVDAIRALATQVSLAIARADLQRDDVERQSAQRFEALIQASSDVITVVSSDGRVRFQSPSICQVLGYESGRLLGTKLVDIVHRDDVGRFVAELHRTALEKGSSAVCECRIRHADGSWRDSETRMTNLLDVPAVAGIVLNSRDVTERRALEAELRHQAFHDSLTGLANRALFANRVEHALSSSTRDGSTIAVIYCVMDGFDRLNESLGYALGDSALILVAERLQACVRGQDTVARLGGNEFGLLLDRLNSPADATLAMERLIGVLRQPLQLPGASVELQPQIGIAMAIGGQGTAEDLLRDSALAVRNARVYDGGYAIFDPEMHTDALRRLEVESQLREALEAGQFVLYYQPTVDLQTGRITGVEALVRWQHPRRGVVPPMEFIPLAEETGLIVPLGQWILREACRQVRAWQQEIPADEPITLSVNLSARQLRLPNIVRDVADALDDTGLLPSRLVLEITESVLMIDTASTLNRLFQLKSLGVRLAVDDFGTGYSSFAYLRRFPVDILKIDKSFVDGVATEPTASALVDAMIRIGKTLHLETVAEGVERAEQADRLRTLQCDIGQGYLFSRPLAADSMTALLRERANQQQASAA
jgi:diguanylate cyclase (GGDEF)-like protein/PAS domain S-box-containing protein